MTVLTPALHDTLRTLKLTGMLTPSIPAWPRHVPANWATWTSSRSCARTRSPAATPPP